MAAPSLLRCAARLSSRKGQTRGLCQARRQLLAQPPELLDTKEVDTLSIEVEPGRTCKLDLFVVNSEAGVRAFENWCPHAGGPLNLFPDMFIAPDRQHIICTRHAARFRLGDGLCVHGPCVGRALHEVPVEIGPDGVTVSEQALRELCLTSPSQMPRRKARRPAPPAAANRSMR
jgi:nitrite reductase/ring-hydroxylating ferredoxin subunit